MSTQGAHTGSPANAEPVSAAELHALRDRLLLRIRETECALGTQLPKIGRADLTWETCSPSDWVAGFWIGVLWLAYQQTGDDFFRAKAVARRPLFDAILDNPAYQDHDLGFQFILSAVFEYRLTGDRRARRMALRAAEALRGRFQPVGRFIKAWNNYPGASQYWAEAAARKMIIDSVQNVSLLFWAHRETGVASYRDIARAHLDTAARLLVRDDFSTIHTYDFDPVTGQPLGGATHQGYADGSCWSRGQAWAIHGFAHAAMNTGDPSFLSLAKGLADYAVARLPADAVPEWDYDLPADAVRLRDSSAGAITAAGLFLVAEQLGAEGDRYREAGLRMLGGLGRRCDISAKPGAQGFLDEGAYWLDAGHRHNMLTYGDYYYLEAVLRALGHRDFPWVAQ